MAEDSEADAARPLLHVVRGTPEPAELAALTAVVAALAAGRPAATRPRPAWAARDGFAPRPTGASPGGWRASALPR